MIANERKKERKKKKTNKKTRHGLLARTGEAIPSISPITSTIFSMSSTKATHRLYLRLMYVQNAQVATIAKG